MTISTERLNELVNNHIAYADMTEEEIDAVVEYRAGVRAAEIVHDETQNEIFSAAKAMHAAATEQVEAARAAFEAVTRRD